MADEEIKQPKKRGPGRPRTKPPKLPDLPPPEGKVIPAQVVKVGQDETAPVGVPVPETLNQNVPIQAHDSAVGATFKGTSKITGPVGYVDVPIGGPRAERWQEFEVGEHALLEGRIPATVVGFNPDINGVMIRVASMPNAVNVPAGRLVKRPAGTNGVNP